MKILVTGGAGYIGSHLVVQLLLKNYDVIIVDSLEKSDIKTLKAIKKITSKKFKFIQGDLKDNNFCKEFIKENIPDTVIHLAAYKSVSEGEIYPDLYYANNVVATQNLIDAMVENKIKNLIFSSTAAVYGQVEDKDLPLNEESIVSPINVYGKTKLEMEKIVKEYALKYGLNATCFRYFNVVGCHESGSMCEDLKYATNLVPVVMKTLIGIQDKVYLFGNDFDTADGSQERDYIDVNDLADAHIKVIEKKMNSGGMEVFNLSTGKTISCLKIFEICQEVSRIKLNWEVSDRRSGDPVKVYSSYLKAKNILDWNPKFNIQQSINNQWQFILKNNDL